MKSHLGAIFIMTIWLSFPALVLAAEPEKKETGGILQWSSRVSASLSNSIAASGQVVSAISSIPFAIGGLVSGTAGSISEQASRNSAQVNSAPIGTPLEITDESLTIMPPNEALKQPAPSN